MVFLVIFFFLRVRGGQCLGEEEEEEEEQEQASDHPEILRKKNKPSDGNMAPVLAATVMAPKVLAPIVLAPVYSRACLFASYSLG